MHFFRAGFICLAVLCSNFTLGAAAASAQTPAQTPDQPSAKPAHQTNKGKALCRPHQLRQELQFVSNKKIDIRRREHRLTHLMAACSSAKNKAVFLQIAVNQNNVEWFLKEKIIAFAADGHNRCLPKAVDYLLAAFMQKKQDHYIRESIIWTLSDTKRAPNQSQKDCDGKIISFLSRFIQTDQTTPQEVALMDFRARMVLPLMLAMVRLGIRNQNNQPAQKLKAIALNHNINDHFRLSAVEALQGFAVYRPAGALGLQQVLTAINTRYINKRPINMKDDELNRNTKDYKIHRHTSILLKELSENQPLNILQFNLTSDEQLNAHTNQFYWKRALRGLPPPPASAGNK